MGVFLRQLKEGLHVQLPLRGVEAVEVQPQIRPAHRRPPGNGADRVQVLGAGHEHAALLHVVPDVLAGLHRMGGEGLVVADALTPQRQPRREEHYHRRDDRHHRPRPQSLQLPPDLRAPVRHDHAAQKPRQVEQLVVVVLVGLEADQLRRQDDGEGPGEDAAAVFVLLTQGQQQGDEGQADVLDVEPQVQIPHALAGGVVHPVELEGDEADALPSLEGLGEGEQDQLGQGQRSRCGPVAQVPQEELLALRVVDHVVDQHAQGAQRQRREGVGVDQRQRAAPHTQQDLPAHIAPALPVIRVKQHIQQVQAGDHHAPAPQQRSLGNHQVGNDIRPAQVVGIGLIGGRLVVAGEDGLDPRPDGGGAVGLQAPRLVEIVEEAQPAVQEEQQRRQHNGLAAQGHFPGQAHDPHEAQRHHQRAGDGQRLLDAPAHQIEGGGQAVHQEGVGQPLSGVEGVIRREGGVLQPGDEAHVHGQIAVGALAHVPAAVRGDARHVRILQVPGQHRQRQRHQGQLPEQRLLPAVPAPGGALVPQEVHRPRHQRQQHQCRPVGRPGEGKGKGAQRGQPHEQKQPQAHAKPQPGQHRLPWEQPMHACAAACQIHQQIRHRDHRDTSLKEGRGSSLAAVPAPQHGFCLITGSGRWSGASARRPCPACR